VLGLEPDSLLLSDGHKMLMGENEWCLTNRKTKEEIKFTLYLTW